MLTLIIGNKNYSSWSLRPWLYMRHSGITFEERRIVLNVPSFAQEIARYDAAGMVPVLLDGGITVWDSLAIIEYLADNRREAAPWPQDRAMRARARTVSCEMHSGFRSLRMELPQNLRRRNKPPTKPLSEACLRDVQRVDTLWTRNLQAHGGPFLFGAFCPADAMFAPVAMRFDSYGVALGADAQRYVDTLRELPALRELRAAAVAETEHHAPYDDV